MVRSLSGLNGVLGPLMEPEDALTVSGVMSNARGAVGAKDESDDDKTVYLHVFTTTHLRIRQQARNVISHNPHPSS